MQIRVTALLCAFAAIVAARPVSAADQPPVLNHCLVSPKQEAQVPAQEAGVVVSIKVTEGEFVKKGDILAQIDDTIPQAEKKKAAAEQAAATEKANSDVNIKYSTAAAGVAEFTYRKNKEAFDRVRDSVPWVEVKRMELEWQRALFQIEQAHVDQRVDKLTANAKGAEVDAAEESIRHRQIRAPQDGIVTEIMPHEGEWVKPGDTVMHIVRMDRLRVEGYLKSSQFAAQDIGNRKVIVSILLAHHPEPVQFAGQVVFVSPLVAANGEYLVRAEVDNRPAVEGANGFWLLHPGDTASMTIDTTKDIAAK
jgi:multidrug efflux pump subunit AcrA (membrane-fusion protein)